MQLPCRHSLICSLGLAGALAFATPARAAPAEGCPAPPPGARDSWFGESAWRAIEAAGYTVGDIEYDVTDVFEIDTPEQDTWYARALNAFHVESRPGALRGQLLFEAGEPVSATLVQQSERRLRALSFLRDARIVPAACRDGKVTVRVETKDAWTLKFGVDYQSTGGKSENQFLLSDLNLLGSGKHLLFRREQDQERTTITTGYGDPSVFGTRWRFAGEHGTLSDGVNNQARFWLPFVANDSPYAVTLSALDTRRTLSFYDEGEVAWRTRTRVEQQDVGGAFKLHWAGDAGWRAGLRLHNELFDYAAAEPVDPSRRPPPELNSRRFRGVIASLTRYHDHFHTFRNLRSVERTEDYNLGLDVNLDVGYFTTEWDSTVDAWTGALNASWAGRVGSGLVLSRTFLSTRREPGESRDGVIHAAGTWYAPSSRERTRVVRFALDWRDEPDPEHELYLGGSDGLLGYPSEFIAADRSWTLHVAERKVTDTTLFQTLRVGWTAFFELAQARRVDGGHWSKIYADVGGGFRLGNLRGTESTPIFVSIAVPLVKEPGVSESYQVVLGTAIDF
jgi:hypothetical protein